MLIPRPKTETYEVTWKDYNEVVLEQDLNVASGTTPEYNGKTPARADDDEYTYEFIGWSPDPGPVTNDVSYTALYKYIRKEPVIPGNDVTEAPVPSHTITWVIGSDTEATTVTAGEIPKHDDPVRDPDEQYNYTFTGWTPEVKEAADDAVYTAEFRKDTRTYTITWVNEDGSELDKQSDIAYGTLPKYSKAEPTKADDDRYIYTFSGWTPGVEPVKKDVTYVASYERKEKPTDVPADTPVPEYTITWSIGSDTETTKVAAGEMPVHADPVKEADEQYTYTFAKWTPDIREATADAAYIAVFNKELRSYTITWLDDAGQMIGTPAIVEYGSKPTPPDVTKASDQQYTYTFEKWEPEITTVTGDATYKPTFKANIRSYTITWQDDTGKEIGVTTVKYGEKPVYADAAKDSDQRYSYTFAGWEPAVQNVTGDATYKATFISNPKGKENKYYASGALKTEYVYDGQGRHTRTNQYRKDGTLESYSIMEAYDDNGYPREYTLYQDEIKNDPTNHVVLVNNDNGDPVSSTTYNSLGEITDICKTEYDGKGRKSKEYHYKADGSLNYYYSDYQYDADGNETSYNRYNADNQLTTSTNNTWENGTLVARVHKGIKSHYVRTIKYDDGYIREIRDDNYTSGGVLESYEVSSYNNQGIKEKYTVYDPAGNITETTTYDPEKYDGKNRIAFSRTFDADGNKKSESKDVYGPGNKLVNSEYKSFKAGEVQYHYISEYNTNGKCNKTTYYNQDGSVDYYSVYEYDNKGRTIKTLDYNAQDVLKDYYLYEYDAKGNQSKLSNYYANGSLSWSASSEYDEQGNVRKADFRGYNKDGSFSYRSVDEYDINGNRIKDSWYESDGSMREYTLYQYNNKGQETKALTYARGGSLTGTQSSEYDEKGNRRKRESTSFNTDGSVSYRSVYEYDENGNYRKTESTSFNTDGSLSYRSVDEYDNNGNRIKNTWYGSNGSVRDYTTYQYNKKGQITKMSSYNSNGKLERYSVYAYDAKGNQTEEKRYNADGSLSSRVEKKYNADNVRIKETTYNVDGKIESEYKYDSAGRQTAVYWKWKKGGYEYKYDDDGTKYSREFTGTGKNKEYGKWVKEK